MMKFEGSIKLAVTAIIFISAAAQASNVITNPSSTSDNSVSAPNGVKAIELSSTDSDALDAYSIDGAGSFSYSENSYGAMGMSDYGSSAWFGSADGGNSSPTVVIEKAGGTADLLQVQDENGGILLRIDSSGVLHGSVTSSP